MTDGLWRTLRKGATLLYIEYGHAHTQLWADNTRARVGARLELEVDLSRQLRLRNKRMNSYIDARDLADGAIKRLGLVQLNDKRIVDGLADLFNRAPDHEMLWDLTVLIEGVYRFAVRPEMPSSALRTLVLRVVQDAGAKGVLNR
jgi:hypothetical protein